MDGSSLQMFSSSVFCFCWYFLRWEKPSESVNISRMYHQKQLGWRRGAEGVCSDSVCLRVRAGTSSRSAGSRPDRRDDPESGQNVYWQMCFKGALLSWSWQRKIPCCSVHLQFAALTIPPTTSWPFREMMDELAALLLLPLSHLYFFSIPLKIEALSMWGSEADCAPPLLTVSNHFKGWSRLWPQPFGTRLLCSGSRQELRFVICRWHEQCLACGCWGGF